MEEPPSAVLLLGLHPVNLFVNVFPYVFKPVVDAVRSVKHQFERHSFPSFSVWRLKIIFLAQLQPAPFVESDSSDAHLVDRFFHLQYQYVGNDFFDFLHDLFSVSPVSYFR